MVKSTDALKARGITFVACVEVALVFYMMYFVTFLLAGIQVKEIFALPYEKLQEIGDVLKIEDEFGKVLWRST